MTIEPFGYFKPEPFGWTDCAETDEGAQPLWDNAAMCAVEKQRDDLLAAIEPLAELCDQLCRWDRRFDDALDVVDEAIAIVKGGA